MNPTLQLILILLPPSLLFYSVIIKLLRSQKREFTPYYDFLPFYPKANQWSIVSFLILLLILAIFTFILFKANISYGPA